MNSSSARVSPKNRATFSDQAKGSCDRCFCSSPGGRPAESKGSRRGYPSQQPENQPYLRRYGEPRTRATAADERARALQAESENIPDGKNIIRKTDELLREYRRELDRSHQCRPRVIDTETSANLLDQLPEEPLKRLSPEWEATKDWHDSLATHQCNQQCRAGRREHREDRDRCRQQRIQSGQLLTPEEAARDEDEEAEDNTPSVRCELPIRI